MSVLITAGSVSFAVISISVYYGWFWFFMWISAHLAVGAVGFYYAVQWSLVRGKTYKPSISPVKRNAINIIVQKMMAIESTSIEQPRKVVISRNLDNALQDVLDLISTSFILSWYQPLTEDKTFNKAAQGEMWAVIDRISRRLSEVDLVSFLSQDVVDCLYQHFQSIRLAKKDPQNPNEKSGEEGSTFILHYWLKDDEAEKECLRNISDALIFLLTSKPYGTCAPIRHLLREIISGSVLQPTIEFLCDPDYINLKLLDYMAYREKTDADIKRTYTYSATYEGFMKMIKSSESVNELLNMRYNIISEILQASAINNLKKQHGLITDKELNPKSTNKGELLKARNLQRYKNQLTVAKQLCEKRIGALGGSIYEKSGDTTASEEELPAQKVFSFAVILELSQGREYFMKYLKTQGADSLLGFWIAVYKLKSASKEQLHQSASEIYQQYITSSSSLVKVDKTILKGLEDFLRGDKLEPESFVQAQKQVEKELEERHYPSFIVSESYSQLSIAMRTSVTPDDDDHSSTSQELFLDSNVPYAEEDSVIAGQSYHAQQRLRTLDNKIDNKARALHAQRTSNKSDGSLKLKKVQEDMEQELENLKRERRSLEMHIARTQKWIDNIGQWSAVVYDASIVTTDDDKKVPQFVMLVSLSSSDEPTSPNQNITSTEGWAISRVLDDFYALHEKLEQIGPWLHKKELPSNPKNFFKTLDQAFMDKAKVTLDEYLRVIMKDDKIVHSEAIYAFLSPTPEFVHQPTAGEKKSKFSLAHLLKSLPIGSDAQENEDDFMFGEDNSKEERSTDSIAKPLYRLLGEVFELQGMFRWVRKSIMSFVEMTFGRSIDRQVKETVDWLVSEPMLIYYIHTLRDSLWPEGEWPGPQERRQEAQKQADRMRAKTKLLENMPDMLKSLIGEDNSRRGMIKIFEVLQNKTLNKHLIYNLLEIVLIEMLPELKKSRSKILHRNLQHQEKKKSYQQQQQQQQQPQKEPQQELDEDD